jgi:hypothetical protein
MRRSARKNEPLRPRHVGERANSTHELPAPAGSFEKGGIMMSRTRHANPDESPARELHAKEQTLKRMRRRLTALARRSARDHLDAAA